jgi:hypothetical protein
LPNPAADAKEKERAWTARQRGKNFVKTGGITLEIADGNRQKMITHAQTSAAKSSDGREREGDGAGGTAA